MFQKISSTKLLKITVLLSILVNFVFIFDPVFHSADAVFYALISKNILTSEHWYQLMFYGNPWLDKPHLPFWLCAISLKLFGIHSYSYILPGFIFYLIGGYYTYLSAKTLFGEQVALYSAVLYFCTLHLLLSNIDLRAESFLLGEIIPAFYYLLEADTTRKYKYIIYAAIFSALAMMTKGPFVMVTITSAFFISWIINKQYSKFISWQLLLYIVLCLVFILPELIALYLQFDLHPKLTVFGKHGVSGVRWFFIDSQFGRFFNTGPIVNDNGDVFFFVHTMLWAMLPYSLLFVYALVMRFRQRHRITQLDRSKLNLLLYAFVPTFVMFSLTKFQLDHYTNIIMPFAAIFTAYFINYTLFANITNWLQYVISYILVILAVIIAILFLPIVAKLVILLLAAILLVVMLLYRGQNGLIKVLLFPSYAMLLVFFAVSLLAWIYCHKFETGYNVVKIINQDSKPVYMLDYDNHSLAFNSESTVYITSDLANIHVHDYYVVSRAVLTDNPNLILIDKFHGVEVKNMMGVLLHMNKARDRYTDVYLYRNRE